MCHDILGHIASAEGAAIAVLDVHKSGILAPGCIFAPAIASTVIAPTGVLTSRAIDGVLHSVLNPDACSAVPRCHTVHHCSNFDAEEFLAPAQPLEVINFATLCEADLVQLRSLKFNATRHGVLDGELDCSLSCLSSIYPLQSSTIRDRQQR